MPGRMGLTTKERKAISKKLTGQTKTSKKTSTTNWQCNCCGSEETTRISSKKEKTNGG